MVVNTNSMIGTAVETNKMYTCYEKKTLSMDASTTLAVPGLFPYFFAACTRSALWLVLCQELPDAHVDWG